MLFINSEQLETLLATNLELEKFWQANAPALIIRSYPSLQDPVYEVQLVWDLGDRVETYGWLWVDALEGKILKKFVD